MESVTLDPSSIRTKWGIQVGKREQEIERETGLSSHVFSTHLFVSPIYPFAEMQRIPLGYAIDRISPHSLSSCNHSEEFPMLLQPSSRVVHYKTIDYTVLSYRNSPCHKWCGHIQYDSFLLHIHRRTESWVLEEYQLITYIILQYTCSAALIDLMVDGRSDTLITTVRAPLSDTRASLPNRSSWKPPQ